MLASELGYDESDVLHQLSSSGARRAIGCASGSPMDDSDPDPLSEAEREFLRALNDLGVRYLLVGIHQIEVALNVRRKLDE